MTSAPFPLAAGQLAGRTVVVTGASRGIGRSIALTLARSGADVVGVARSEQQLAAVGDEVVDAGGGFLSVVADLADVDALPGVIETSIGWHGRVDGLVNAAGLIVRGDAFSVSTQDWDRVFAVNTRAPFFLCQAVGRHMLDGDGGAIVNVTSLAGQLSTGAPVPYCASKAALAQMTRVLAARWAPRVRVNAVAPGYVRTELNEGWLADPTNAGYVVDRTPMGRIGQVEDVADLVLFLLLPHAGYITGQNILIDGGWSTR